MGKIIHRVIVCVSWNKLDIESAHQTAKEYLGLEFESLLSPLIKGIANGYQSFFIAPAGLKLGWPESDLCETRKQRFLAYMHQKNSFVEIMDTCFGDDLQSDDHYFRTYGYIERDEERD